MILSEELEDLFCQATLLPVEDRLTFASMHCSDNTQMHQDLLRLLDAHAEPNDLLDHPLTLDADLLIFAGLQVSCSDNASILTELQGCLKPSTKPGSLGRIGHFEVYEVLGRGASATVLKAQDQRLHRVVALKVLSPKLATDPSARERFTREARIAARITDQNLVAIYDVEDQLALPFIVMEYFSAISLHDYLKLVPKLSVRETIEIAVKISKGLSKVHAEKIFHRDLKPGNILVQPETGVVKITDFGIAKTIDGEDPELTLPHQVLGTPMFMSPEQVQGLAPDERSDLFSFGSILYRMLTSVVPFDGPNAQSVMKKLVSGPPRPVHELVPEVPEWLSNVVSKLHQINPEDRYQTAEQVIAALEAGPTLDRSVLQTAPPVRVCTVDVPKSSEHQSTLPKRRNVSRLLMFVTPPLIVLLLGVLLKLQTANGQLIVMCDDLNGKLKVEASNGTSTELLELEIGEANRMCLKFGPWKISLVGESADEYIISSNEIQVVRGGVTVVKVLKRSTLNPVGRGNSATALMQRKPVNPAIEALLSGGAMLVVRSHDTEELYCSTIADLPETDFEVHSVYLGDRSAWKQPLDFELLSKFPKVALLDFSGTTFSDSDLPYLRQFRQLTLLDLRDTKVTDAGMTTLANSSSVLGLTLEGTSVGVEGLRALSRLRSIESLTLSGAKIDDEAMRAVAEFPNLCTLSCINCPLTDEGMRHCVGKANWQQLTFYGTDITDVGIKLLCDLADLRSLILENNLRITDACVDDLMKLSTLEEINVRRTGISPNGRRRLLQVSKFHGSPDEP